MKKKSGVDTRKLAFALLVAGMLFLPAAAPAQGTGYLRVVGAQQGQIRGESKDSKHQGWIEILSFSSPPGGTTASTMSLKGREVERMPATGATTARTPIGESSAGAKKTQTTQTLGQPGAPSQPQPSGSQPRPGEIKVLKKMDTSSPRLLKAAEAGELLKEVVIEAHRPDGKGMQRLTLEKAIIGSIQQKSQGMVPQEEVTFHFQKLTVEDF